jgi:hypothetical protein
MATVESMMSKIEPRIWRTRDWVGEVWSER